MNQVWTRILGSGIVNPHLAIGRGLGVSLQSSAKLRAVMRLLIFQGDFLPRLRLKVYLKTPSPDEKKATSVAIGSFCAQNS